FRSLNCTLDRHSIKLDSDLTLLGQIYMQKIFSSFGFILQWANGRKNDEILSATCKGFASIPGKFMNLFQSIITFE
ncbi:hypothetical protein L9F63_010244, partial [Diploptera punctata]